MTRPVDANEQALCGLLGIEMAEYAGRCDALSDELGRIMRAHTDGIRSSSGDPRIVEMLQRCIRTSACLQALAHSVLDHADSPEAARAMLQSMPIGAALTLAIARRTGGAP